MSIPRTFAVVGPFAFALAMLVPAASHAQAAAGPLPTLSAPTTAAVRAPVSNGVLDGPRRSSAGVRIGTAAVAPELAPMRAVGTQRDVAWMIVGGATLLVGSVIGGDSGSIIMITGGVIGLVGLLRYVQ